MILFEKMLRSTRKYFYEYFYEELFSLRTDFEQFFVYYYHTHYYK